MSQYTFITKHKDGWKERIKGILVFLYCFYKRCSLADPESATCNEDWIKDWCGAFKNRKYGRVRR